MFPYRGYRFNGQTECQNQTKLWNDFSFISEDFCISNPCQNGALCDNNIEGTGYECVCDGPYNGKDCENSIYEG